MNPEITLDDYREIGTMETALSEHADEAFFELSAEGQKIAEKIFKCLTETDRENREIRRATTIEKLCAVSEADFSEVAAIIEVFRKEGRTFLMPPPEVPLNKNSLIDISHESLIRKWERLKKWVEEEGQSARTYRRLAEDALLHQQNKMGFWSDPELKDALEWRENFKPNETWAQLYKETGERQYKASFAESMQYLDESEIRRDEEIAEDKRQQDALKSSAVKVQRAAVALFILFIASLGVAGYAFFQRAEAVKQKAQADRISDELRVEKNVAVAALDRLEKSEKAKTTALDELTIKTGELETKQGELTDSLKEQEAATKKAEDEKKRADEQTKQAKLSETEKQKALEQQKRLAAEAKVAQSDAIKQRDEAKQALARLAATTEREEFNRIALTSLEQGEYVQALYSFQKLLESYENESEPMSPEFRTQGKWWASHNLGIVNSKINRLKDAEQFYIKALNILGEPQINAESAQLNYREQRFRRVSYQADDTAVNRSKIATLRRLAQLYRSQVETSASSQGWQKFTTMSVMSYNRLLELMKTETFGEPQMADVYVELADALGDSYDRDSYEKANDYYIKAADIYERTRDFVKEVAVLKKLADLDLYQQAPVAAARVLSTALEIQESEKGLNLLPVNLEIADTYDRLAKVAEEANGDVASVESSNYAALAGLISDLNFHANIKGEFSAAEVTALANAYVKIGKCRKAESVYIYAANAANEKRNEYLRFGLVYLTILNDTADFYQNVMRDNQKAQENFDKFVAESARTGALGYLDNETPTEYVKENIFERAGDFYLARGNFRQAEKLYGDASKIIEAKLQKDKTNPELIQAKAKILVKEADFYEAQNKLEEAEASYMKALSLLPLRVRAPGNRTKEIVLRARVLIQKADFYKKHGNKEKMATTYTEISATLEDLDESGNAATQQTMPYIEEIHAVKSVIYKKLGDFYRDNVRIAAGSYEKAVSHLEWFSNSSLKDKSNPYFKNNKFNAKYYSDLAETYEAWMSLNGVQLFPAQKRKAEEARKKADELKLEEQESPCEENK